MPNANIDQNMWEIYKYKYSYIYTYTHTTTTDCDETNSQCQLRAGICGKGRYQKQKCQELPANANPIFKIGRVPNYAFHMLIFHDLLL